MKTSKLSRKESFGDMLIDARILADFSNINTQAQADQFKMNYPDFVPPIWWRMWNVSVSVSNPDSQRRLYLWNQVRDELQTAWVDGFSSQRCLRLIVEGVDSSRLEETFTDAQSKLMQELEINPKSVLPEPKIYPYQQAIMFLAAHGWRAKFCNVCGKRFVAGEPKQGACSDTCRQQAERNRKNAWWSRSGRKQRRTKQKQELRRKSKNQKRQKER
jgi:hypothetical protein